jgi:hypothetical protein
MRTSTCAALVQGHAHWRWKRATHRYSSRNGQVDNHFRESHEIYGIKRPRQLANRDAFLKIGEPIDLGRFVVSYLEDAQAVRRGIAEQLRAVIQGLIDAIVALPSGRERSFRRQPRDSVSRAARLRNARRIP